LVNPGAEYAERLAARLASAERFERLHVRVGNLRLLVFLIAAAIAWGAFARDAISPWWLAAPAAGFLALLVYHDRVIRDRDRARRAAKYYERAIARIEDRWMGSGESGERFRNPNHPYADDLDLFGKGSLFELLSTARTRVGEDTLAGWLLAPAAAETVRERQAAIEELRPKLDLREELALLGEEVGGQMRPDALAAWAEAPPVLTSRRARITVAALSIALLTATIVWLSGGPPAARAVLLALLAINLTVRFRFRRDVHHVAGGMDEAERGLSLLARVLSCLEREQFTAPRLAQLRARLDAAGLAPSKRIARLHRLMELFDSCDHELMRFIGPPLLYDTQLAFAIESWRVESGSYVGAWIKAVGEFEALSALAGYAYERPLDTFPEIVAQEASFEAAGLGHPLLPEERCVRNDLTLSGELGLLVVSGSNMSGKSTLLRSVGVAAVMALAGAPVRAARLRISSLAVGASIRSNDSLQDGKSRFYAEITRLRQLVDLAGGPRPLLFLIDELLNGTNSHDRRIGAEAVVRGLVNRAAIGLITTHDLALTEIAESLAPRAANVHFEDHLENGRITFDYLMRPGVVRKSNALELMRSVGLDI
jgi:hypothetical protein